MASTKSTSGWFPYGAAISVNKTKEGYDPKISALPNGRFAVAWRDSSQTGGDTYGQAIRAQVFGANGGKIGSEILANTTVFQAQSNPSIATFADGDFVIVWEDQSQLSGDLSGSAIRGRRFFADGAAKDVEDFLINTTTANAQVSPRVAGWAKGGFVVVWTDHSKMGSDPYGTDVRGRLFGADGSPNGDDFKINTTDSGAHGNAAVSTLSDGRFIVAWEYTSRRGGSMTSIRGRLSHVDGSLPTDEFPVDLNSGANVIYLSPCVTSLPNNDFLIGWTAGFNTIPTQFEIGRFYTNGSAIGQPLVLPGQLSSPSVADLADGKSILACTDSSSSQVVLHIFIFNANLSIFQLFHLTLPHANPSIRGLSNGRFVVVWQDNSNIWAQMYRRGGPAPNSLPIPASFSPDVKPDFG